MRSFWSAFEDTGSIQWANLNAMIERYMMTLFGSGRRIVASLSPQTRIRVLFAKEQEQDLKREWPCLTQENGNIEPECIEENTKPFAKRRR